MNTWFPDKKLLWMGENVQGAFHNIYTLRWSKYIDEALQLFGKDAEIMFASHQAVYLQFIFCPQPVTTSYQ
jgi:alkyl sulfatase BDS1-like metallo-beta-lactamase superfamily hydrolase